MPRPGRDTLEIWANSEDVDTWTWFTDDAELFPKNLDNFTALLRCYRKKTDVVPLLALRSDGASPAILLGGSAGTINRRFVAATTAGLVVQRGYWSLVMTNTVPTPDEPLLLIEGDFILHAEGGG